MTDLIKSCYGVVMNEDEELDEMLDWLDTLRDMDDMDFRSSARPHFNDTVEMISLWNMEGREAVTDHIARNYKGKHRA